MHDVILDDHYIRVSFDHTDGGGGATFDHPVVVKLLTSCKVLAATVPVVSVKMDKQGSKWDGVITTNDGRVWREDTYFDGGPSPEKTFNVTHKWRLHELQAMRPLRDSIVELWNLNNFSTLSIEWK